MLEQLVPIVDQDGHHPLLHLPSCQEILLGEGWSEGQVHEWLMHTIALAPETLQLLVNLRRN